MQKTIIILLSVFTLSFFDLRGDTIYIKEDVTIFDDYVKMISRSTNSNSQDLIINTAKFFLNKPYVGGTLDRSTDVENLVVNFRELDCNTFVETCLALYSTIRSETISFSEYKRQLAMLRYRDGLIDGYSSRLHYSTDWIYENEKRGFWKNISVDLNGHPIAKTINYMSNHPQLYKQLKNNKQNISRIKELEQNLELRKNNYVVIPKAKISEIEQYIQNGDVVVFATAAAGLDYSHMGIAYWVKDKLHFIHASSLAKKVVIEPETLTNYCNRSKNCIGISVLRVN